MGFGRRWRVEETETGCLRCEINEIVQRHIERDDPVNLPDLVAKVGESLVDLILLGPEERWGNKRARAVLRRERHRPLPRRHEIIISAMVKGLVNRNAAGDIALTDSGRAELHAMLPNL